VGGRGREGGRERERGEGEGREERGKRERGERERDRGIEGEEYFSMVAISSTMQWRGASCCGSMHTPTRPN
jgi:hypothetical protein